MSLTTYNQVTIPAFMYGTAWKKDQTKKLVELAIANGFTAIDTANQIVHYDEAQVGEALLNLQKQGIERGSLFIQTKFTSVDGQRGKTPYDAKADLTTQVNQSIASSFTHLHTDYLDSYVLHGPYSRHGLGAEDLEVWRAMEAIYESGQARILGVSNVTAEQLSALCQQAKVRPMLVQNRCYASMGWDRAVREICLANQIVYQGFSLLTANMQEMAKPSMLAIAERLNTGVAQVVFRFAIAVGMLPLTGTTNARHMQEDLQAENLNLSSEDIKLIEQIGTGGRY